MNLSENAATLSSSDNASLPLACSFFNWTLGCQSSDSRPSFGVSSKSRKKKENRRKVKDRKRKRVQDNVRRVHHICVASPLDNVNDLPQCLRYPPPLAIPEVCIKVEAVAAFLFRQDAAYIAHLIQANYLSNAAGSRLLTNPKPEVRDRVYCVLYPEEYTMDQQDDT